MDLKSVYPINHFKTCTFRSMANQ